MASLRRSGGQAESDDGAAASYNFDQIAVLHNV
jgi:hypothetical protein